MKNRRDVNSTKGVVRFFACLLLVLISVGCQSRPPIFPAPTPAITWPPGDIQARFKYVGELKQADDLKPVKHWWQSVGDFVFGKDSPKPMYGPRSILVLGSQRVWVADPGGRCLHRFDLETRQYKKITGVTEGKDEETPFIAPVGMCQGPGDTFFVCDSGNAEVYQFKGDGTFIRKFHLQGDVDRPTALCYIPDLKRLYILDTKNNDIKVYALDNRLMAIIGKRGVMPGEFNFPIDLKYDGEWLWVSDAGNGRVQALTLDGKPVRTIGRFGKNPGDFALPKGLAVDSKRNIYVVDSRFENIQIFNRKGVLLMHLGHEGSKSGEFSLPSGIFIDSMDRIWVCDTYNHRIQLFKPIQEVRKHAE